MESTPEEKAAWNAAWTDAELAAHGLRSVLDGGMLFCGVNYEEYAINGVTYQWPRSIKLLRWGLNFSRLGPLSDMDFKDAATAWFAEIAGVCDRQFEYTSNPRLANILYTVQRLDGPAGVLADMQIPAGNLTPDSQPIGRFDDSEAWVLALDAPQGKIDLYTTGGHETEHAMGLGHRPASVTAPARIAPIYDPRMRYLQAADIAELQRRYGPSKASPPSSPAPPLGDSLGVDVIIKAAGVTYRATGAAKKQ